MTGNGNALTNNGVSIVEIDGYEDVYYFDGVSDYLVSPDNSFMQVGDSDFSLFLRFKPFECGISPGQANNLYSKGSWDNHSSFWRPMCWLADDKLSCTVWNKIVSAVYSLGAFDKDDNVNFPETCSDLLLEWHTYTLVRSDDHLSVFNNGVLVNTTSLPLNHDMTTANVDFFTFGAQRTNGASGYRYFYEGYMDDIYVYDRALNGLEVEFLHNITS